MEKQDEVRLAELEAIRQEIANDPSMLHDSVRERALAIPGIARDLKWYGFSTYNRDGYLEVIGKQVDFIHKESKRIADKARRPRQLRTEDVDKARDLIRQLDYAQFKDAEDSAIESGLNLLSDYGERPQLTNRPGAARNRDMTNRLELLLKRRGGEYYARRWDNQPRGDSSGSRNYSNLTPAAAEASKPKRRAGSGRRNPNAGMRQGGAGTPSVKVVRR